MQKLPVQISIFLSMNIQTYFLPLKFLKHGNKLVLSHLLNCYICEDFGRDQTKALAPIKNFVQTSVAKFAALEKNIFSSNKKENDTRSLVFVIAGLAHAGIWARAPCYNPRFSSPTFITLSLQDSQ